MLDFAEVQRRAGMNLTHIEIVSPLVDTLLDPERFDGAGGTTLFTQHECERLAAIINSQAMMLDADDSNSESEPEPDRSAARIILGLVVAVLWLSAVLVARL